MGIGFYCFITLAVLALSLPKSKGLSIIIIAFMWIVYGLNIVSGDNASFEFVYNNLSDPAYQFHYEPAFSLLMLACYKLGLPFQCFRMVLASLFLCLTFRTVKLSTQYIPLALILFITFPFLDFVSQLRAGIASAIVLFALCQYANNKDADNKAKWKYVIGVALATLFHYSSLFYLIELHAIKCKYHPKHLWSSRKFWVFLLMTVIGSVIITYTNIPLLIVSQFTHRAKTLVWFSGQGLEGRPNAIGMITQVMVLLLTIFVSGESLKSIEPYKKNCAEAEYTLSLVTYNMNVVMLVLIPFMAINSTFMRLLYESFLLTICSALNSVGITKTMKGIGHPGGMRLTKLEVILFSWIIIVALYVDYGFNRGSTRTVWDILSNNVVFINSWI